MKEEQYQVRGMFHQAKPPSGGPSLTLPAMVPLLSATPGGTKWAGPNLGEHTDEVLRSELNMSPEKIQQLRGLGAI
jgi:crotonobetainyl-CoA:carnitine CoA-transferase CaiB-like acyl-CoA transferase